MSHFWKRLFRIRLSDYLSTKIIKRSDAHSYTDSTRHKDQLQCYLPSVELLPLRVPFLSFNKYRFVNKL